MSGGRPPEYLYPRGIPVRRVLLETYLGPWEEWYNIDLALTPARLRAHGWDVLDGDSIADTVNDMIAGTLKRLPEAAPAGAKETS